MEEKEKHTCKNCKYYPPSKKWACIDCDMSIKDRWEKKEQSNNKLLH